MLDDALLRGRGRDLDAAESDFQGTRRFQLLRRLGAGWDGVVYEALDRDRDTRVALKTFRSLNAEGLSLQERVSFAPRRSAPEPRQPRRAHRRRRPVVSSRWGSSRGRDFLAYVSLRGGASDAAFQPTDRLPTGLMPSLTSKVVASVADSSAAGGAPRPTSWHRTRRPSLRTTRTSSAPLSGSSRAGSRRCTPRTSCTATSSRPTSS